MVKFNSVFAILFSATLFGCYGKPPTEFGKQTLQKIEGERMKTGTYPVTIEGNLLDIGKSKFEVNDFYYIVDSTRTSFTLSIFTENGLSDIYDNKTKQWVRTDK